MLSTYCFFGNFFFVYVRNGSAGANKDKRALTAAFDYLIMGTIGATFFVIALAFCMRRLAH